MGVYIKGMKMPNGECARAIGGDAGNISRCLHTDKSDTHKGFHFERVVQYE
jgi:hypothetical protein